ITSSSAATQASSAHKTALGLAEATDLFTSFPASFAGQSVDNTSVLVRYTYFGDADLSGTVDTIDFSLLAATFSQSGKSWFNGDFDYNGLVDTIDFSLLASNFAQVLPASGQNAGTALVPESSLSLVLALAVVIPARRRARRQSSQMPPRSLNIHGTD